MHISKTTEERQPFVCGNIQSLDTVDVAGASQASSMETAIQTVSCVFFFVFFSAHWKPVNLLVLLDSDGWCCPWLDVPAGRSGSGQSFCLCLSHHLQPSTWSSLHIFLFLFDSPWLKLLFKVFGFVKPCTVSSHVPLDLCVLLTSLHKPLDLFCRQQFLVWWVYKSPECM